MSVQFAGSRSPDDRRRRRMAVAQDVSGLEETDAGGVMLLRERLGELPAASPWLPRQVWKRGVIAAGLWTALSVVAVLLLRPFPPHPELAPAIDHLTLGARPILTVYAEILLWTLAGQFAAVIGWYRSHSQLDFQGRYRVWAWAALVLTAWGFFAGTGLHSTIAAIAGPRLRWPLWRAETLVWLIPAAIAGLSVWSMIDRDMRRCRVGVWLLRLAALTLLLVGTSYLFKVELSRFAWSEAALTLGELGSVALLLTSLWLQACYVAYISADPPEAAAAKAWRTRGLALVGYARYLWPFRRRSSVVSEEAPKRRKKKGEDDSDEATEAAPKRRRKPAAKTKRTTTRTRTRVKPEIEDVEETEEYNESESGDESWDERDSSTEREADWLEEYDDEQTVEDPSPPPAKTAAKSGPPVTPKASPPPPAKPAPPPPPSRSAETSLEDDEEDDDGTNYRVDGSHGANAEMFKGLSKRQRRELRKQMKDQQRQQRGP